MAGTRQTSSSASGELRTIAVEERDQASFAAFNWWRRSVRRFASQLPPTIYFLAAPAFRAVRARRDYRDSKAGLGLGHPVGAILGGKDPDHWRNVRADPRPGNPRRPPTGLGAQVERNWERPSGDRGIPNDSVIDRVEVPMPVKRGDRNVGGSGAARAELVDGEGPTAVCIVNGAHSTRAKHIAQHVHSNVGPVELERGHVTGLRVGRAIDRWWGKLTRRVVPEVRQVSRVAVGDGGAHVRRVVSFHQLHVREGA